MQLKVLESCPLAQVPFHLNGIGPMVSSLKLSDSGQIPVSRIPMMASVEFESERGFDSIITEVSYFKKSHDRVVWSCNTGSGKTDTTPGFSAIERASSADRCAANPEKPLL